MSINLKFVHTVNAPASQVYRAFTNATALREWLCDTATVEAKVGGRFYVAWNSGYYASGEYVKLQPDRQVTFIWSGRDDPAASQVTLTIKELDNGATTLSLEQSGLENSPTWAKARDEISRGWNEGLDNLVSTLENGPDLRIIRRPMIGVLFGDFNKKLAEEWGMPISEGLRLDGVVDGLGAQKAGLQKNDVIVMVNGKPTTDFNAIVNLLQHCQAGDTVEVVFYRGPEKKRVNMELASRPLPEFPKNAQQFGDMLQKIYRETDKEMATAFEGVSDAEASAKTGPDSWSAAEVVAHLIQGERDTQSWINDMVFSQERVADGYGDNLPARIAATAAVYNTRDAILAELFRSEQETVYTIAHLPDDFVANKAAFWHTAFALLEFPHHTRDHIQQIKEAIAAARK